MSEASTLAAIHGSITEGPAWHGPAVSALLADLDAQQAAVHPINGLHSIWELVLHMNAWQEYAVRALQHQEVQVLQGEADWPPVGEPTDARWNELRERFKKSNKKLRELLDDYDNQGLRETIPGGEFTLKVMLHGLSHHNAYHAGQIGLLKRMIEIHFARQS